MRKYLMVKMLILCLVTLNLSGCVYAEINKVEKGSMIHNNIPYSIRSNMSFAMRNEEIEKIYGKPGIVRELQAKTYEIRDMSDGSLLFVFYDKETNRVYDIWRLKKLLSRQSFERIKTGKATSEDIMKIDPYTMLLESSKETGLSEHRLKNNEAAIIKYKKSKGDWVVEEINYINPDPSGFTKTVTEDDLLLIS